MDKHTRKISLIIVFIVYYAMIATLFIYNLGKYDTFTATMSGFWDSVIGLLPIFIIVFVAAISDYKRKNKDSKA